MRETHFIKQNKKKWTEFEGLLKKDRKDPDKLSDLFIQITDDLSYSRTFYPNRSVRVYLNSLAQQLFYNIYKTKKIGSSRFSNFWREELPQLVWDARKEFLLSLVIFLTCAAIGVLSCMMNPDFPTVILGERYVNMTNEYIANGDPMAVYKQQNELDMSFAITFNNLRVAFMTFISGVFFGIGTIGILIKNAVMVGTFQYFFIAKGLFLESFLTIWIHGTLEISAIIIAGAAGLTLGRGLVFPGTYTRLQAFQMSARRGLKIMLGIVPIIIAAGFIEGFVTRYTDVPNILRFGIILSSLGFILSYFVWYPYQKAQKGFAEPIKEPKLPLTNTGSVNFGAIKSTGQIVTEAFTIYRKNLAPFIWAGLGLSVLFTASVFLFFDKSFSMAGFFQQINNPSNYGSQFMGSFFYIVYAFIQTYLLTIEQLLSQSFIIPNTIVYSILTYMVVLMLKKDKEQEDYVSQKWTKHIVPFAQILISIGLLNCLFLVEGFGGMLFTMALPFTLLWVFSISWGGKDIVSALARAFSLGFSSFGRLLGLLLTLLFIGATITMLFDSQIMWFLLETLSMNIVVEQDTLDQLVNIAITFLTAFSIFFIFPLLVIGFGLLFSTMLEIKDASSLRERINTVGIRRSIRGMDKE